MNLLPVLSSVSPGGGGGDAPELRPGLNEQDITPGIEGFLFTALVVVLLIVVVRDLAKRTRRMKYRAELEDEAAGEEPEFPGEITEAEISAAQQRSRVAAAEARFGPTPVADPAPATTDTDPEQTPPSR
ncbi:hypothetical protein [Nesterenkonia halotolerans]|uniref:Uncharacterized protein n=1 Tax=Nesterenkonia halotolerans TaxID=225325 RepID=A0ABR9J9K5_9MICC|nr:hypothetical protein [Nesterenkonia halotolerans]MBE1515685.1 hypothetical protein [Nesterenkonia halotolerans]